ncbi:MAG: hypothetical protein KDI37_04690 [Xanthomonadales bacterium]|nr:hypothetical protein [Xanthomonadales bacterium]
MHRLWLPCLMAMLALPVTSQASESPYVAESAQPIKALPPARVEGLLAGQGLGYAKAAELNGYPGPKHVLELAEALQLSSEQHRQTEALYARMAVAAQELGARLVEAEGALDRSFADRSITDGDLVEQLKRIGQLESSLRAVHLQAHLEQTQILNEAQRRLYIELRGYANSGQGLPDHAHSH